MASLQLSTSAWQCWLPIILSLAVLLSLPKRIRCLRNSPEIIQKPWKATKMIFPVAFLAIQFTPLVKVCFGDQGYHSLAIFETFISFATALGITIISLLELKRNVRPSRVVTLYLALSLLKDCFQIGISSSCMMPGSCHLVRLKAFLEVVWLILEPHSKELTLHRNNRHSSTTEEAAGLLSQVFFWWIIPVLKEGYKNSLSIQSLPDIHSKLSSERLRRKAKEVWATRSGSLTRWSLPLALVRCLSAAFLSPIIPRIFLIFFRYVQPILIGIAIRFVTSNASEAVTINNGYQLVLFATIVYLGMAVSAAIYQHQINRLQIMTRGALIGLIHHQSLNMEEGQAERSEALTLMSSDIDSIESVGETFHETWASLLEAIVGTIMLASQIRWFAFLPLIIVFGCSRVSAYVAKNMQGKQKDWNTATQKRISTITALLSGIKSLKMMGMEDSVQSQVTDLRNYELRMSERLRWISIAYNASANALGIFAPVVTLILYAMSSQSDGTLRANEIFTSIALLAMVTHPANMVMTYIPRAVAVMANFARVQSYIDRPSMRDSRDFSMERNVQLSTMLNNISIAVPSMTLPILRDICLNLKKGEVVVCSGSVGSGKTTLAMAMLGEVQLTTGSIRVASRKIAFCAQRSWLPSVTIREAISGGAITLDEAWYNTVVDACDLVPDLASFVAGDMALIENNGINLSGGQRQRIALARAIYARYELLVLDDPFSALDGNVTNHIVHQLLGQQGLLKRTATTVFLISNLKRIYPFADKVLVLENSEGHLQDPSHALDSHQANDTTRLLSSSETSPHTDEVASAEQTRILGQRHRMENAVDDTSRRTGDVAIYRYYFDAIGRVNGLFMTSCTAVYSFCFIFSQYILKWATESTHQRSRVFMGYYAAISWFAWVATNGNMWSTQTRIAIRSGEVLHAQLLEKVLRAPLLYFTETEIGVILNKFGQDISLIDKELPPALANLSTQIFKLLMQIILLLVVQPVMVITVPACFIVVYFIQRIYLRTSRQLRFLELESRSQLYTNFLDTTNGVTTIRAFGWKDKFENENVRVLDLSQKPLYILLCLQCWLKVVLDCLMAVVAVILISLTVAYRNTTTGADIGLALNMIIVANTTLLRLVQSWTTLETSLGAIARLKSVQECVPNERVWGAREPGPRWPSLGGVRIENVSASYNPQSAELALQNLSLQIAPAQKLIIVGRTGSGKSTLMLSLLQLLNLRHGFIQIDDIDITHVSLKTLRQRCFIAVPQDGFIIPTASLRFNLDPDHVHSIDDIVTALKRTQLWDRISSTYLEKQRDINPDWEEAFDLPTSSFLPLSAGQLQLFALCRTLLRVLQSDGLLTKPIVVLDEVSSSLDPETESVLEDVLREELRAHTVIIIAHRVQGVMNAMRPGVDAIVTMQDGQLQKMSYVGSPEPQD